MLIEIFDRWLSRRKIGLLKNELAHAQDERTKHVLEDELAVEEEALKNLKKTSSDRSLPAK